MTTKSSPTNQPVLRGQRKGKVFLEARGFLSPDKASSSNATAHVRTYDDGYADASLTLSNRGDQGYTIYCSPGDEKSVKNASGEIDAIIEQLTAYKKAINAAHKAVS